MPTTSGTRLSYHTFKFQDVSPSSGVIDRSLVSSWSKTGDKLPDWRKRIQHGYSATTNFSGSIVDDVVTEGSDSLDVEWKNGSGVWIPLWGNSWGTPIASSLVLPTVPSDSTTVLNQAKARLIQEIRSASTALQGGVAAGELGETLRMIRRPFKSMYDGIPDYLSKLNRRTRKVTKRAQARKIVADTWLEQAFGWRPLMSDIADGCEALERMKSGPLDIRDRVRASARSSVQTSISMSAPARSFTYQPYYRVQRLGSTHVEYYLVAGVKIKDVSRAAMNRRLLGFRLTDFVPTLYELLPWSFLIDYFSNLGDVISGYSLNWSTVYFGVQTRRLIGRMSIAWYPDDSATESGFGGSRYRNLQYSASQSHRRIDNKTVSRVSKTPGLDWVPDFQFEIPGCSTKWLNIAALAATRDRSRATFSRLG